MGISREHNKHLVICTGGLPASGTTLVPCLLAQSLFKGATRVRVSAGANDNREADELDFHGLHPLPHTLFDPHHEVDWTKTHHRGWLHDLIHLSPNGSQFILDVSAGNPKHKRHAVSDILRDFPFLSQYLVDLVMLMKPDNASVYRTRSSIADYCGVGRPNIRVTAVFNNAAGGKGGWSD